MSVDTLKTPISPDVSPRSYQENLHTVADETSYENHVKQGIIDGEDGHKRSDERPKTVRSMHPGKEVVMNFGIYMFLCEG